MSICKVAIPASLSAVRRSRRASRFRPSRAGSAPPGASACRGGQCHAPAAWIVRHAELALDRQHRPGGFVRSGDWNCTNEIVTGGADQNALHLRRATARQQHRNEASAASPIAFLVSIPIVCSVSGGSVRSNARTAFRSQGPHCGQRLASSACVPASNAHEQLQMSCKAVCADCPVGVLKEELGAALSATRSHQVALTAYVLRTTCAMPVR